MLMNLQLNISTHFCKKINFILCIVITDYFSHVCQSSVLVEDVVSMENSKLQAQIPFIHPNVIILLALNSLRSSDFWLQSFFNSSLQLAISVHISVG